MEDYPKPQPFAVKNVRVFNGDGLSDPTTVYISEGLISHTAEDPEIIDADGGVLLPGLIDAHIHLNTVRELHAMARHGVTTGLDMATWPPSKIDALRRIQGVTDFRTPGLPATSPGSMHSVLLPLPKDSLLANPQDAVKFVQDRIAEGVDYIKMVADYPGPDQDTLNAIVSEAHKHGKLVVAHAADFKPFQMAQDAGADVITHAPCDKPLEDSMCQRMFREKHVSVPTLTMMQAVTAPVRLTTLLQMLWHPFILLGIIRVRRQKGPHAGKPDYKNAKDSVTALHRAGVPILAGTDAHEESTSPVSVKHGESLHRELELLVEAGLSRVEALQAATSLPAEHFGLNDRGVIEVGKRADLLLLTCSPLDDIKNTRSISRVWCAGIPVKLDH